MTLPAPTPTPPVPVRALSSRWWSGLTARPWALAASVAVVVVLIGAGLVSLRLPHGVTLTVIGALALVTLAALMGVLYRYPWLIPWGALLIFCSTDEVRLRLSPAVGTAKDIYVVALLVLLGLRLIRQPAMLTRLNPLAKPLICLGVLVGLYLVNPAGGHGRSWIFGARMLLEVLALLAVGMLCANPAATTTHLLRAMTVILPVEACFAWLQQLIGGDALVHHWLYQYGAQARLTSTGGLRTSGTFDDPFQLDALAVVGVALALFAASRRQAVILLIAAGAILAATSVRTTAFQVAVLILLYAVRRGWWRQAVALGVAATLGGLVVLATTTTSTSPGAPPKSLLVTLNGRTARWEHAVPSPHSLLTGNGVGAVGSDSNRAQQPLISTPPSFPSTGHIKKAMSLDSAYAQVQSDVGIAGTLAMLAGITGLAIILGRRAVGTGRDAAWAGLAVLTISMIDWVGRSSLASYTTGFITMYVLGVLIATSATTIDADQHPPKATVARPIGPPTRTSPSIGHGT